MLQIFIHHEGKVGNEAVKIAGIINKENDNTEILAKFNEENGCIDLSVCAPYVGQEIKVKHVFHREEDSYEILAILDAVEKDSKGAMYIGFTPKEMTTLVVD